jgi:hypothetical protein
MKFRRLRSRVRGFQFTLTTVYDREYAGSNLPWLRNYNTNVGWRLLCKLYCNIDTDRHEHEMETSWIGTDFVRALNEAINRVKMAWSVRMTNSTLAVAEH